MNRYHLMLIWMSGMAFGMPLPMTEGPMGFLFFAGFSISLLAGAFWQKQKQKAPETPEVAASGDDVLRVYALTCTAENGQRIGFRTTLCSGRSEDEAIGSGMRKLEGLNPEWRLSTPAALEITPERLEELGVVVSRDGVPEVMGAA